MPVEFSGLPEPNVTAIMFREPPSLSLTSNGNDGRFVSITLYDPTGTS